MRASSYNQRSPGPGKAPVVQSSRRVGFFFSCIILIMAIIIARLFYLQIIKYDDYRRLALSDQQKEYTIAAQRGSIKAHGGNGLVPLVLNQQRYTLYADPTLVKDPAVTAKRLAPITGDRASDYIKAMKPAASRYQVLTRRLDHKRADRISRLRLPGIGLQAVSYRVYPQGDLAAQTLGFVNNDGQGSYGVEQYLNQQLAGRAGKLKAVTDVNGVPLAASPDNTEIAPIAGSDVVLTLDVAMQKQLEKLLRAGLQSVRSLSGSAVIIDPYSGAVKAMANWPSYNPVKYYKVKDQNLFNNANVSSPLEVGSVMKVLTAAAALDQGVVKANTTYIDPGHWELDGHSVTNVDENAGAGRRSLRDILQLSLNTGATWMLMQMGGGQINQQARQRWHDYMTSHYQFGRLSGIEQGYESGGVVPDPVKGSGLDLAYANTAFGQAMTATPLQMAAALGSVVNGGSYYRPRLVEKIIGPSGKVTAQKPKIIRRGVVKPSVSRDIRQLMEYMVEHHVFIPAFPDNYAVGGKTGTPQIANPAGGYYTDRFNGTYIGYVGGKRPQYVIVVRVNEPKVGLYAGSGAAQPIFGSIVHMLINDFSVIPRN